MTISTILTAGLLAIVCVIGLVLQVILWRQMNP